MINPYRVSLQCSSGHSHFYDLDEPGEVECKTSSCSLRMNSSRVFRGIHPHIIWTGDRFQDESNYLQTFTVIPLTSKTTFLGLPTTYPIVNTARNGLSQKSYALIHQLCTVDGNCFKDAAGSWLSRMGQIDLRDRKEITKRLKFWLNLDELPSDNWLRQNASGALVQKVYGYLSETEKRELLERLLDDL